MSIMPGPHLMQTTETQGCIVIIDDDEGVREALALTFDMEGFATRTYKGGDPCLEDLACGRVDPHCILLDVHMPKRSGLDVLEALNGQGVKAPVLMISGQGDIPIAVNAMKLGAYDFIEKPFDPDTIIAKVKNVIEIHHAKQAQAQTQSQTLSLSQRLANFDQLSTREREVLAHIVQGASNKEAGRILDVSPRTIEAHRAKIMEKLGVRNMAELARIVFAGP